MQNEMKILVDSDIIIKEVDKCDDGAAPPLTTNHLINNITNTNKIINTRIKQMKLIYI